MVNKDFKPKDTLYKSTLAQIEPFSFGKKVAHVFDDMVTRSIPLYQCVQNLTAQVVKKLHPNSGVLYDLGCSTGSTLYSIAKILDSDKTHLIGIDSSEHMVQKCQEKIQSFKLKGNIEVHCKDLLEIPNTWTLENASGAIMHYVLQFMPPHNKKKVLQNIAKSLPTGGFLILSEKLTQSTHTHTSLFTDVYYDFKSEQGYSELEIAQKREALENVLTPLTTQEICSLAEDVGFDTPEVLCQWMNFGTFLLLKR
jgi:tRNA (cmo5U34)-methyltransferase